MTQPWAYLDPHHRHTFDATIAFLEKRLAEQGTIEWAIKLRPAQWVERLAVEFLLHRRGASDLAEPWVTSWRLIQESWSSGSSERRDGTEIYNLQERIRAGERTGALISAIVELVAPRLMVESRSAWHWNRIEALRSPKTVEQVISARLTSDELIDLNLLQLPAIDDLTFLRSLAIELDAAMVHGLSIAGRVGWKEERSFLSLGMLNRVYYTQPTRHGDGDNEADAFHRGIAPSVKLLHAVVSRIAEIQSSSAQQILQRWSFEASAVHVRLWAAMARDTQLVSAGAVSSFLQSTDDRRFWDLHAFPEIAELRAIRFAEFDLDSQRQIAARIQKGPPRDHWPSKVAAAQLKQAQLYWSIRELKRIEAAGGSLPTPIKSWLDSRSGQFSDLDRMTIEEGFLEGITVTRREAKADLQYDALAGKERLKALEVALGSARRGWDDDPSERANNWINTSGNAAQLLSDLENARDQADEFPKVWDRFGWAHRPPERGTETAPYESPGEQAGRVLFLLNRLSDRTLEAAIEGLCAWLDAWRKQLLELPLATSVWTRLWPLAVAATNSRPEELEEFDLSTVAPADARDREPHDLDTLNTPAGKLIGVFLAICPPLAQGASFFVEGSTERLMRDIVISAGGRSSLIARHRMIEALPYFLHADGPWAKEHLIAPLLKDDGAALALWRAVARRVHFTEVLKIIGGPMAERAVDLRLGRETRRRLVFSLVVESLHAFREVREPAVPNSRLQQTLRTLDDEVRASAANAVQQFVSEVSAKTSQKGQGEDLEQIDPESAASLFRRAAVPFFREVWPQERSLATPGTSSALADLPASAEEAFAEAVDTIARFLVPFECWSMLSFGLYGSNGSGRKLEIIRNERNAGALLKLLDLTVGTSPNSTIPYDLSDALDQIRLVAPKQVESPIFRRLSTAARR